jgi:hypothetical protein
MRKYDARSGLIRSLRKQNMTRSGLTHLILAIAVIRFPLLAQEPPDLQVQLRSATSSNRFRIGEEIPIEVLVSSTNPSRYLEPCELFVERGFGFPQCRFFSRWEFAISPEEGWVDFTKMFGGLRTLGGPLIAVPIRDLTSQPSEFSYLLTDRFRFDKPGEYHISLSIQVGVDDETTQLYPSPTRSAQPHSFTVHREIILEIVPAEAAWQEEIVRKGEQAYSAPRPQQADPPSPALVQYRQATRALCILGTPEAARVLVKALAQGEYETRSCLERSPNVPAAIAEMKRLLVDPDFGVTPNFFQTLVLLLNLDASKKAQVSLLSRSIVATELDDLFAALPLKRSDAQIVSLATVLQNPSRTEPTGSGADYELPFAPPVIATAAANFDRLPLELQERLLMDHWDTIRSPLMLPIVRGKAEAGDGPALLRWAALDPHAAAAFTREEIVRPHPRLSSYYLRLPDKSLSTHEQQQIATNFVALTDDFFAVHAATLLHRYATRAVLATVLPFIDAKLNEWPCSIQLPALAYLLKVAPKEAQPLVERALAKENSIAECTNQILTHLGFLNPSPVLDKLAMARVAAGGDSAIDGAQYLKQYGPPAAKPKVWDQLHSWHQRFVASGAEKRVTDRTATQDDMAQAEMARVLTDTFVSAQGWVLSPEEANRVEALASKDTLSQLRCNFQCGAALSVSHSVGPKPSQYVIYAEVNPPGERWRSPMEYLNPAERLYYSIDQYHCAGIRALEEKIMQLPTGSSLEFGDDFTVADRDALVEISDFLWSHDYKVRSPQNWNSLRPDFSQ